MHRQRVVRIICAECGKSGIRGRVHPADDPLIDHVIRTNTELENYLELMMESQREPKFQAGVDSAVLEIMYPYVFGTLSKQVMERLVKKVAEIYGVDDWVALRNQAEYRVRSQKKEWWMDPIADAIKNKSGAKERLRRQGIEFEAVMAEDELSRWRLLKEKKKR